MECFFCGTKIEQGWEYCGECGTNVKEIEKTVKYIEKGLEFEAQSEYSKSAQEYRKVLALKVPHHKALEHLERITAKEEEMITQLEKGVKLCSKGKWGRAIRVFEKILSAFPSMEAEVQPHLVKAKEAYNKGRKYRIILNGIIVIIVVLGLFSIYKLGNSPEQKAQRILKQSSFSKDVAERQVAIEAFGRIGDKRYLPILKNAVQDEVPEIRIAALKAFGEIKDSSTIPLLKECLFDKDWKVSMEAAKSLAAMGDTAGVQLLKRVLE